MRLLVKEVLRSVIMTELDKHASCSRTNKHWEDSLVKPVIIIIMMRHISAAEEMLPCFHMLLVAATTLYTVTLIFVT